MLQTTLLAGASATTQQGGSAGQMKSVILGATIGVVGSLLTLVVSQLFSGRRWRRESRLKLVEEELRERRVIYPKIITALPKVSQASEWPMDFLSDLCACAPREAIDKANSLLNSEKSVDEKKKLHWEIVDCLTADLLKRQEERRAIVCGGQRDRQRSAVARREEPKTRASDRGP